MDLAAQWRTRTGLPAGEVRAEASLSHQPGRNAGAEPEFRLLAAWRAAF